MSIRLRPLLVVLAVGAMARPAHAAEPENVVVRNRLYSPKGTLELGIDVSSAIIERLVSTTNLQAVGTYNITNEWAAELLVGYAFSGHTSIADQVTSEVASKDPSTTPVVDDFSGLWEIKWNVMAGARWAPIYGKLSLSSELPVHFQAYLAGGAGVMGLSRTSVTYCLQPTSVDGSGNATCADPLVNTRTAPAAHLGGGLRFWLPYSMELRIEVRDYIFTDQYQVQIQRAQAEAGDPTAGTPASNAGIENVVFMTAGLSYIFVL